MWSSTTTANSSSDNKNKEDVEDCRCSSAAAVDAVSSGGGSEQQQKQQQQQKHKQQQQQSQKPTTQLNIFETNSKKQTTLDGNTKAVDSSAIESGDSGFISGPQTSEISEEQQQEQDAAGDSHKGATKLNIPTDADDRAHQPAPQPKKSTESSVLDSGCIDEEEFAEDDCYEEQAKEQQVQNQLSSATVATGVVAASSNDQMLLKQNVESGMSEWFCNLSLQTEGMPSRPQQVSTVGLNNLNSSSRRSGTTSAPLTGVHHHNFNTNRQQQQQQTAGNAINTPVTPTTPTINNLTPSNAWEHFYQQNDDGDTPLHLACISGYVDVVAALIRMAPHPCLFNIQNDEAQTPLHLAVITAQPKILRMLLIAGAEPTIRDRFGNTALHLACKSGEEQCVRALTISISASEIQEAHRQYGHRSNDKTVSYLSCARLPTDLEMRNYDGERCVHLAAQSGHIDILRILVLYGADINAREGRSGRTPLHFAIENCNEDLANFLLDECQKLNLETATYSGLTAYQVACVLNKSQLQNMLEKRGAEPLTPPDSDNDYDSSNDESDLEDDKHYDRFGDPGYFISYNGGKPSLTVA